MCILTFSHWLVNGLTDEIFNFDIKKHSFHPLKTVTHALWLFVTVWGCLYQIQNSKIHSLESQKFVRANCLSHKALVLLKINSVLTTCRPWVWKVVSEGKPKAEITWIFTGVLSTVGISVVRFYHHPSSNLNDIHLAAYYLVAQNWLKLHWRSSLAAWQW